MTPRLCFLALGATVILALTVYGVVWIVRGIVGG